jgi:serine/threonine protein kinase
VVYKGIDETGNPVAIRVFSTESPHRHGRYEKIGEYLTDRRLACLVSFEYREEEIRSLSDGNRYPIVLMDWVEGETLFQWVQNQCRSGNAAALASAAHQWPAVIAELSREQLVHGDLQHANIMVTPDGQLKLVDYDGMCVPALIGADCLEYGTPPYQHPHRQATPRLSLRLDDFSALLIYVALQALAADPTLWRKYVEQTKNDKLLFREDDFRFPQRSALRRNLRNLAEPGVRDVAEHLFAAAAGSIEDVPLLDEVIQQCKIPAYGASAPRTPPQPTTREHNPPGRLPPWNSGKRLTGRSLTVPTPKVPGYKMLAEVGRGALGAVFLATSESTGQPLAVKVMPIRTQATEILRRRFLAEMDRVAQSPNLNIVGLIERGTIGHAFYFVTEYCAGGNLTQWMESTGGKLKSADVRPVMQQCLDALKHAHLHRLVHGHITPQNILFASTADPRVAKISDFAVATQFGRRFSGLPTQAVDLHAAGFIPPERLTSDHGLDLRSDLWALAAVFYYALSGSCPWNFRGRDPHDVIPREDPMRLQEREDAIPASVAEVIDRALRPNPAWRYQSATEMKAAWDTAFNPT